METTTSGASSPSWHQRGAVRAGAAVVLVIGLVLLGVGIWGLVSASGTNGDADTTEEQAVEIQDEAYDLRAERDQAITDAEDALDAADALDEASSEVRIAADDLGVIYRQGTEASNAMAACGEIADDAQFLQCLSTSLGDFQAKTSELEAATDTLRQALADLEEGLQ